MREMARRSDMNRRDLFRETAALMKVHPAIAEKDFWVCWALDYLFQASPWKNRLGFKGGTSLSKAYGAIERFSEDIDLILDWTLLGYARDEPWKQRSRTRQDQFGQEATDRTTEFLKNTVVPALRADLSERAAAPVEVNSRGADVFIQLCRQN